MSFVTMLQDAFRHSVKPLAIDGAGLGIPAINSLADVSRGPHRESAEGWADRDLDAGGPWIGCCERSGVVEIHDPRLLRPGHQSFCRALVESAVVRFEARRAEVDLESATCRLEFGPVGFDRTELAGRAAGAIRSAIPAVRDVSARTGAARADQTILAASACEGGASGQEWRDDPHDAPASAKRPLEASTPSRRLVNLAMAGGSFALAVGGVILPGIPTLPFVIMTGRYAVRVSPRIERVLMGRPWCAALLANAETSCGQRLDGRSILKTIGLAVLFAAAFLILHPPLPVVLSLELGLMAFLAWRELGKTGRIEAEMCAVA